MSPEHEQSMSKSWKVFKDLSFAVTSHYTFFFVKRREEKTLARNPCHFSNACIELGPILSLNNGLFQFPVDI